MDIPIIYEDDSLLAINKPSGVMVHGARPPRLSEDDEPSDGGRDGKNIEPTLVDWVLEHYPQMKGVGEPLTLSDGTVIDRPGIVHRLDKDTSGVLLLAKDQETFLHLKTQFQAGTIAKTYIAIVHGIFEAPVGVIDTPIGRSRKDFRLKRADATARGNLREARTEYRVLGGEGNYSLVEVYPKTGRTHQIRVHMASIKHPVVCDPLYGGGRPCPQEIERLALHAYTISFIDQSGLTRRIQADTPEDIVRAIKELFQDNVSL